MVLEVYMRRIVKWRCTFDRRGTFGRRCTFDRRWTKFSVQQEQLHNSNYDMSDGI
eukprot:TRINITY_DN15273_c0_g1_i1.p3 TRINITY_DN15273_c0_g1~~TRINITY_DN15273_c0_g1_i1.p3  ORF type:complete len:55 (+),score=5.30 TRINITY_DN15273_c0_g1_i1:269-433(+)